MKSVQTGVGVLASLVILAGSARALGQNALGDGRIFERDLRVQGPGLASSGLTPRPNFMNEVAARNAAVTGNAANGGSLQIIPPYRAPGEFHGNLATDQLFNFQRDSLASTAPYSHGGHGYAGLPLYSRGLWKPAAEIVTRLDDYGLASEINPATKSKLRVPASNEARPRSNINPDDLTERSPLTPAASSLREANQWMTSPVGTLRSVGAYTSTTELSPSVVGYQRAEGVVSRVTASGLLGLHLDEMRNKYGNQRTAPGQQPDQNAKPTAMEAMGLTPPSQSASISATTPAFRTSYEDLRDRLTATALKPGETMVKPAGPENVTPAGQKPEPKKPEVPGAKPEGSSAQPTLDERIKSLRERLQGVKPPAKSVPAKSVPGTTDQQKANELAHLPGAKPGEQEKADENPAYLSDKEKKKKYAMAGLDQETLEIIRNAGGETKSYTSGAPASLFDAHLKAGQEELAKGQYFDAEERFARALALRPGDVTVQAARLNAQIGAGLYVSAANNLRQLFQQHPEVIGVHYTGETMPASDRLKAMITEMRENIAKAKSNGQPPAPESGLLLAYVGYQTHDPAAIKQGLEALQASKAGAEDPLVAVLEGVWEPTPKTPAPAAPAPATPAPK